MNEEDQFVTVLASRQTGKSTTIGALAYDDVTRGKTCLLAAPSQRQSQELLRRIVVFLQADPVPPKLIRSSLSEIETAHGGRVVSIPATDQARGFTADTIVLDEAAWLDDTAISALLPMRKTDGRVLMLSTPYGREGFFHDTWAAAKTRRIFARSVDIPRLKEKVAYDQRFMSEIRFRAEHLCEFSGIGHAPYLPRRSRQCDLTGGCPMPELEYLDHGRVILPTNGDPAIHRVEGVRAVLPRPRSWPQRSDGARARP